MATLSQHAVCALAMVLYLWRIGLHSQSIKTIFLNIPYITRGKPTHTYSPIQWASTGSGMGVTLLAIIEKELENNVMSRCFQERQGVPTVAPFILDGLLN